MRIIGLVVVVGLLLVPVQVMSGKGYIDMRQMAKEWPVASSADAMATAFSGVTAQAMMSADVHLVMTDEDCSAWRWDDGSLMIFILKTSGQNMIMTMIWVTSNQEINDLCRTLNGRAAAGPRDRLAQHSRCHEPGAGRRVRRAGDGLYALMAR